MFHCLVSFTSRDIGQYVYCNCMLTKKFGFLIMFSLHVQKVKTKIWISWERRELLGWNKKTFFIIFKGTEANKGIFLEGERATLTTFMSKIKNTVKSKKIFIFRHFLSKLHNCNSTFPLSRVWHPYTFFC